MKITVVGTGYVGLVAGTCFSDMGNDVYCIDKNPKRIDDLKKGIVPIYEPGLAPLVKKNFEAGRLNFSMNLKDGFEEAEFIFIAVGTPPAEDGSADLQHVLAVADEIGQNLNNYKIIVNKSTVPVGTGDKVKERISQRLKDRGLENLEFDVVSNPEFLKEGDAINDFMKPDRVVIGADSEKAKEMMQELYSVFFRQNPRCIVMDVKSAEVTKYAANSMLATKISFMNEISNLCDSVGADVEHVRIGIGADKRIGYSFIYPGIGYGGSCFPKDVKAIIRIGKKHGCDMKILQAVEDVNDKQKSILFQKMKSYFENKNETLKGKKIAIWGLSFKPETDDMREAPSKVIIRALIEAGATVAVHDPKAMDEARHNFEDIDKYITYCDTNYDTLKGADALALLTEWHSYRQPDFDKVKQLLNNPVIFDGRNLYQTDVLREMNFDYISIGRR